MQTSINTIAGILLGCYRTTYTKLNKIQAADLLSMTSAGYGKKEVGTSKISITDLVILLPAMGLNLPEFISELEVHVQFFKDTGWSVSADSTDIDHLPIGYLSYSNSTSEFKDAVSAKSNTVGATILAYKVLAEAIYKAQES